MEQLQRLELLTAQLCAVTGQVQGAKVSARDFLIYGREERAGFPPDAAMVAIALKAEGRLPREIIPVWPQILEASERGGTVPETRWLAGDGLWLLAPQRTDRGWRGLLVARSPVPGAVVALHDPDRPLRAPVMVRLPRLRPAPLVICSARLGDA